ncbi:hypothetical protein ZWY2020_036927 [Hordeum vulgare]|nr:hypothetical protein ZWY2020_036927 [Hordeum vulgare]
MLNTAAGNPATTVLALRWFLENAKVRSKVILYNVVLKHYCLHSKTEALWDAMPRDGVQPDNTTFSTVISCARTCGLPGKAVEWFEKMPETGCSPDMLMYSVLIDTYGRAGDAEMALRLYDHAWSERCQLDPVICATVIKVHSTNSNFDDALNVFEEMKVVGVKPTLVVYNTVLDAMGRAMRLWVVKTIHREMVSQKVQPNRATYCCLLQAYTRARYGEDPKIVYRKMKDEVMDIDVVLYNMLLSMCADIGYVEEAEEIFTDMKSSVDTKCKPDSRTYSSMVTLYSCTGNVPGAEAILKEMAQAGFKPNIFTLTSLIRCYGKVGCTDNVVRSFGMLEDLKITPDDGCLLTMAGIPQWRNSARGSTQTAVGDGNINRPAVRWSDLPDDLLGMVILRIASLHNRVRSAAVCKSWRATASQQPAPPATPLLLLLPWAGGKWKKHLCGPDDSSIFRVPPKTVDGSRRLTLMSSLS